MTKDELKILAEAKKRFAQIQSAESNIREAALQDMKFAYNVEEGQWDANIRSKRENATNPRPCLTANKFGKFIARVANIERENRIGGKVVPASIEATAEKAFLIQNIITKIEHDSLFDEIYTHAGEQAISSGFGYWRIVPEYEPDSFDQVIKIKQIDNQFSVYFDPDERFCFIRKGLTREEFEEQYPNAKATSSFEYSSLGDENKWWYEEDLIYIAEYFVKERYRKTVLQIQLPDGKIVTRNTDYIGNIKTPMMLEDGSTILKYRDQYCDKVMWYKISGHEILESQEWPGKDIPVIEVVGNEVNVGGKIYKKSLIRDGKDMMAMLNYWLTSMTEKVALSPKTPWLVTKQEISGHEPMWNSVNDEALPYLLYNAQGTRVPQRAQASFIDAGAMSMLQICDSFIKDILGIYEASLGEPSNERSGRAIIARKSSSDLGVYMFHDNLSRAIMKSTRILVDLVGKIHDTERIFTVYDDNGNSKKIVVNSNESNDIRVGRYDVVVTTRPFSTQRQELRELIKETMQYAPQVSHKLAPLLFEYVDVPGVDKIVSILKDAGNAVDNENKNGGVAGNGNTEQLLQEAMQ